MSTKNYVGIDHIQSSINHQNVNLVNSFFNPQEIVSIEDIKAPGVYGGSNIFDPTQYSVNGVATPTDNESALETYYKNLIGSSINSSKNGTITLASYRSNERPAGIQGLVIFDTDLGKVIVYNGTTWVDQAGRVS